MSHLEAEATYAPSDDEAVPDLTALPGVESMREQPPVQLSAHYFDTADLALLRAGVTLRRRTGGTDEGWHLKVPTQGGREEIRRPLGTTATPPKALRDLVRGWTRDAPLSPVATIETRRTTSLLVGAGGEVLAEFADDRVTGSTPDGAVVCWREWELELVEGTPEVLEAADDLLARRGVERSEVGRKLERVVGDRVPPEPWMRKVRRTKPVARLVQARLAEQVGELARHDVGVRRGEDEGVHRMRVACRRLRAVLATFRPTLDRARTDPLREELRWLAQVLGRARDPVVVHERLRGLLDDEPPALVTGPVRRRLRDTYAGRGHAELRTALDSGRYLGLRTRLDALAADPPWTEVADRPARKVAAQRLRHEWKRVRARTRALDEAEDPTAALHDLRKAVKRLRYAAETVRPLAGKTARGLARDAHDVTALLGELQDTAVTRTELVALSRAAAAVGEPTFTYGRLHAREEARAGELLAGYKAWETLDMLKSGTSRVGIAVREK